MNQTYKNLEIILVDDGSTDKSPAMCDEWAKRDSRVRVIHKKNGAAASARNAGLDIMSGSLVGFVDSDDYIALDMYEKLYNALTENNADLSACNLWQIDENGNALPDMWVLLQNQTVSGIEALSAIYSYGYGVIWNKLYKREIFDSLRFKEGYICEDEIIIHRIFGQCKKIALIADRLYFYIRHNSSIMGKAKSKIFHPKHFKACMFFRIDRYHYLESLNLYELAERELKASYSLVVDTLGEVNYFQYRKYLSGAILQFTCESIKSGKFSYWLRAVKIYLVCLRSLFRPYINEEDS